LKEKLSAKYLSRLERNIRYDQRAATFAISPEEPSRNLKKISTENVLWYIFEKTDEDFHERYGHVAGFFL
jgi:hypothetical protein